MPSNLNLEIPKKQELLEITDIRKRLEKIYELIDKETSVVSVEKKLEVELKIKWKKLKENII